MASSRFSATKPRAPGRRLGSETPRIFTPPLRPLNPETSLGFSVIEFAVEVLGIELYPWQRWLLIHALELRPTGGFRFRNVVVLVARQNGKSTLSQVLALWFMYVYGFALVLGTAQDLDTAEEIWQGAVDLVTEVDEDDVPVRPELAELWSRTVMVNGKKSLELKTGARYKAKAASRRAGRGLSGDLVMLDELREHQTWDAWGAITKTTMARDEAMIWAFSNAGDALSVVLAYLRRLGHAALGDPDGINAESGPLPEVDEEDLKDLGLEDDDSLGIFEWSATPDCDIWDRDEWAQGNPSLGYAITERTIAAAARTDPEEIFRTEVLCQWVDKIKPPPAAIDLEVWKARCDLASRPLNPVALGIEVSPSRQASLIAAGWRSDGRIHGEVIATGQGTAWVLDVLLRVVDQVDPAVLVIDKAGPAGSLIPEIEAAGLELMALTSSQRAQADEGLVDDLEQDKVRVIPSPPFAAAVETVTWRILTNARAFERRTAGGDITPIVGLSVARFGLLTTPPPRRNPAPTPVAVAAELSPATAALDLMSAGF